MSWSVNFFFSSRRRHTRLQGDWSSDVCSSDLCDLLSLQDGGDELLPNGLGGLGLDTLHVIPEMLGSQLRRRSRGPNARQGRAGNPIPHRLFADRFASAVDRGQTDVITGAQPLGALRA